MFTDLVIMDSRQNYKVRLMENQITNAMDCILTALIVDDEATNRFVLSRILRKQGYKVIESENGQQAVAEFNKERPDIVFMDVLMPVMDGYEATRQIKELAGDDFIPVIFLTALSSDDDLEKAILSGGDEFISKPYEIRKLQSKIFSLERTREAYRRIKSLKLSLEQDNQLARELFQREILQKNHASKIIKSYFDNTEKHNSDIYLVEATPANGLNILLGEFNVKGLSAVLAALPITDIFRTMTGKGFSIHEILNNLNKKICQLLPQTVELSLVCLSIDHHIRQIAIVNYDMPTVLIYGDKQNKLIHQINPQPTRFGRNQNLDTKTDIQYIYPSDINHIIFYNQYVDENLCCTPEIESDSVQELIAEKSGEDTLFSFIEDTLNQTIECVQPKDSMSLVAIPLQNELTNSIVVEKKYFSEENVSQFGINKIQYTDSVSFSLNISGRNLVDIDPIPMLINFLQSIGNIDDHQNSLYTIFTELYVNALDHGILGLNSDLKSAVDGFANYFKQREILLADLTSGSISIDLDLEKNEKMNRLNISVKDTGTGFDASLFNFNDIKSSNMFSGRGIMLVNGLCEKTIIHPPGNHTSAVYCWPAKI